MPVNFRPTGVLCNNYIYSDGTKESPYMRLKRFLFEQDTGRTDVVFLCSAASGFEPQTSTFDSNNPANYHAVGGLIDGIAKAIVTGNNSSGRPNRSLYATSVKYGYESNVCPNFDIWNSTTWSNPNTTGAGGFLAGTSTAYGSYFYYTRGSKKQTGYSKFGHITHGTTPHPTQINYSVDTEVFESFSWSDFTKSTSLFNPLNTNNNSSRDRKFDKQFFGNFSQLVGNTLETVSYFSTTEPAPFSIVQTPEAPQRFWQVNNPIVISNPDSVVFDIGIGYIENGVVVELFDWLSETNYIPAGLIEGTTTEASVLSLGLIVAPLNNETELSFIAPALAQQALQWRAEPNTIGDATELTIAEFNALQLWTSCFSDVLNKKLIIRRITWNQLITISGLNIKPTPPVSKAEYLAFDGYRINGKLYMRWMFANPQTLPGSTLAENQTFANKTKQSWGLALRAVDDSVTDQQNKLPYLRTFGTKSAEVSNCAFNLYNWACQRSAITTDLDNQFPGTPITFSTINPCGIFSLTKQDIPELAGTSPTPTIDKERCMVIHPNFGKVYSGIIPIKGGLKPTTRDLTSTEKDELLGIFKSPNFKYVSTVFYYDDYEGDAATFPERKAGIAPYVNPKIVFTGITRSTTAGSSFQNIQAPYVATHYQGNTVTFVEPNRRKTNRVIQAIPFNLSSVNSSWNQAEFRFGFVGKNSAEITGGSFSLGVHYGIDTSNQNGIAFTKLLGDFQFRNGDLAYTRNATGVHNATLLEVFRAIAERQQNLNQTTQYLNSTVTNNVLNSTNTKKKLVIFYEIGIWELANPNTSYAGINGWAYLLSNRPNNLTGDTRTDFGLTSLAPLENVLLLSGFTRDEFVVVFYTPSHLTTTSLPSIENSNPPEERIYNLNSRSTFVRASEFFVNNFLLGKGLYNSGREISRSGVRVSANSCYINLGRIPTIFANLTDVNVSPNAEDWYVGDGEQQNFTQFTPAASLAIGEMFLDYLYTAAIPTINFVPPWLPPFSRILNYTTDPVSQADLTFTTISTDPVDIEPYLVEFDALCDQGNIQAKRTLSRYKTKILQ
jgi:hypothetical protein